MAFSKINISTKNIVALMIALALAVGLTFNFFDEKSNSLPFKLAPIAEVDHVIKNKHTLSENTLENSSLCNVSTNVLPVRLTISGDNRIKSFGEYISEDYLFMTLQKRSYDCESVKLYFSLEEGVTDDYLNQLIAKIDKLEVVQVYRPAILHAPPLLLTF